MEIEYKDRTWVMLPPSDYTYHAQISHTTHISGTDDFYQTLTKAKMSNEDLEASVIPEGRISRNEAELKLHLSYLDNVTAEDLLSLTDEEIEAATDQVISLFSSALARIYTTHQKWLLFGFNCGSEAPSGDHRNSNPNAQIKRDAGWHFSPAGVSCDASDIAAEQQRAFREAEKKQLYRVESSVALDEANMLFRKLIRAARALQGTRDAGYDGEGDYFSGEEGDDGESGGEMSPADRAARFEGLLTAARALRDKLVDLILRFLPGRTFLKS